MRFLDLYVFNLHDPRSSSKTYKLTHRLAYKDHSSFSYTSSSSNIHSRYKHAIVPIGLHRIHTRCSLSADKNHHMKFLQSILACRMQDPEQVLMKVLLKKTKNHKKAKFEFGKSATLKIDMGHGMLSESVLDLI